MKAQGEEAEEGIEGNLGARTTTDQKKPCPQI
jgi:hypothetical protein